MPDLNQLAFQLIYWTFDNQYIFAFPKKKRLVSRWQKLLQFDFEVLSSSYFPASHPFIYAGKTFTCAQQIIASPQRRQTFWAFDGFGWHRYFCTWLSFRLLLFENLKQTISSMFKVTPKSTHEIGYSLCCSWQFLRLGSMITDTHFGVLVLNSW